MDSHSCFPPQNLRYCGPMDEECVEKASEVDHGCQVKCTGLYADVWYSEEDTKLPDKIDGGNTMLLNMLKDGGKNNVYFTIVTISLSVVNNIPMNQEDKQARLSYILESNIAKTSLESKHRQELAYQMRQYEKYKQEFARNIVFDPTKAGLSKFFCLMV